MSNIQKKGSPLLLVGVGNLGGAILDGLLKKNVEVTAVVHTKERADLLVKKHKTLKVEIAQDTVNVDKKTVIMAVKPGSFGDIRFEGRAKLFVSVMAKVYIDDLKSSVDADAYIRAMPNLAARCEKSVTAVTGSHSVKTEALALFESIGKSVWVDSEDELNIATALAGSAPAFLALVAEALTDGAVRTGLKRGVAEEMTKGLFDGFSALLEGSHPAKIKEEVMSPKGTTAAGVFELEKDGVRASFMKAIEAAYLKASK